MLALGAVWVDLPAVDGAWENLPARYEVPGDTTQAQVFDADGSEVPCKLQQHQDNRYLFWTRTDPGSSPARYRIVLGTASSFPPPVFVGAGDVFDYGRNNVVADLGVGMWAKAHPIDWDDDGDMDLLYCCNDRPQGGVYVYHHVKGNCFRQGERIGKRLNHPDLCDFNGDGKLDLLTWPFWYDDIKTNGTSKETLIPIHDLYPYEGVGGFILRQVDWDGDGKMDLLTSGTVNEKKYPREESGWDTTGDWTRTPSHGYVWWSRNIGTNQDPKFERPVQIEADDRMIDLWDSPVPNAADWDGDGDLDLLCADFIDEFVYFENVGTRTQPRLARGRVVLTGDGVLKVEKCMMSPSVCDWNSDGLPDLLVGQEDGRVSVMINQGVHQGAPQFKAEFFLEEKDPAIKAGGLSRPWVDPVTRDLYVGNPAGYIEWFKWTGKAYKNGTNMRTADGVFRVQAGYNGSIQGPAEAKWGYTVPTLGDIDNDGDQELVFNSCFGRIESAEFLGKDRLSTPEPVQVAWEGDPLYPSFNWWKPKAVELVVQWRSRPAVVDWNKDGINDLVLVDHEGYLALYAGQNSGIFLPGERIFRDSDSNPLRLNDRGAGKAGRVKIQLVDWDADGDLDLIRDSLEGLHVGWFENTGDATFVWKESFPGRELDGHTNAAQAFDWNDDGALDLLIGAEDGRVYAYHRAALEQPEKIEATTTE